MNQEQNSQHELQETLTTQLFIAQKVLMRILYKYHVDIWAGSPVLFLCRFRGTDRRPVGAPRFLILP